MKTSIRPITYRGSSGTAEISAVSYYPEGEPLNGAIVLCHGMAEHIGRYHDFMLWLAGQGYAAIGFDQLGHGKTAETPEQLGWFGEKNGYQNLIRDLHLLCRITEKNFPGIPVYLLGHSMGSLVSRLYVLKFREGLSGLILSGPPGPNPMTAPALLLTEQIIRRQGPASRPDIIHRMLFNGFNKKFVPNRTENDWLTRDDAQVDRYNADPLCGFHFTAAAFRDLFTMMEITSSKKWAQDFPKDLPVLILSGDCDPVGDFGKGVLKVYNRLLSAGATDVTLQFYEGARHELLNETNRDEVREDILTWIKQHHG